jgi:Transposase, Mutator family
MCLPPDENSEMLQAHAGLARIFDKAGISASAISTMNQRLDDSLAQFARRRLAEAFPYLILEARYERVREAGVIVSQAVLIAIGIDWTAAAKCWRSNSPIARAGRAGGMDLETRVMRIGTKISRSRWHPRLAQAVEEPFPTFRAGKGAIEALVADGQVRHPVR